MKIGEFAKKHNITQDTIRHYLELGLLATEKKGGHYDFSESDSHDLIQIMELKNLSFSLNEIQRILTIQRIQIRSGIYIFHFLKISRQKLNMS